MISTGGKLKEEEGFEMLEVDTFENVMLDDSQLAGALVKTRLEPTDESTLKIITVTSNESGDTYNWEEI
jgi:hypothetical protein